MEKHPRGFKFRTIVDRFAWDLLLILRESLAQVTLDSDHLKLRVLMTLSDVSERSGSTDAGFDQRPHRSAYVKDLLFRDFSADKDAIWHVFDLPATAKDRAHRVRIHDEAITYLSSVLERRLTLAQNLKEKPTNLHLLLVVLSRHSTRHPDWRAARACRDHDLQAANEERAYFQVCAHKLAEQRTRLGAGFGAISQRRREAFGPLWLVVNDCKAELPEEFSLFDVCAALPLALAPEFIHDTQVQKYLVRVLDSAGLPPQTWLEKSDPSIAVLRDLKQLRADAYEQLGTGQATDLAAALRSAFDQRFAAADRKKIAGCRNFGEFSATEYGMALLKYFELSLDQSAANESEGNLLLHEAIPGADFEEDMVQSIFARLGDDFDWVRYLMDARPELFDDVTTLFFEQAIGLDRPLDGATADRPLLSDRNFRDLLKHHPRYKNMKHAELAEVLIEQANEIIDQGIGLCASGGELPPIHQEN